MGHVAIPIPNPFVPGKDGPREVCRIKYERLLKYLRRNPHEIVRVYPKLRKSA